VTIREPEWDAEQADIMIALGECRALTCGGCGGHLPDTTAGSDPDAWTVEPPTRCYRCTALAVARESYADSPQPQALLFAPRRREITHG
jgi:hypothetical protein